MAGVCRICKGTGQRRTIPGERVPLLVAGGETCDSWPAYTRCERCAGQGIYVSLAEAGGRPEPSNAKKPDAIP